MLHCICALPSLYPQKLTSLASVLLQTRFIYKLAVKCCSLFDSLQLIAHNLFRFQDALFINDDIFQKAAQLAALHIAYIFHVSETGHMQNHFTVTQTQARLFGRKARGSRSNSFTHLLQTVGKSSNISLHLQQVVYSSKSWNSVNETVIYY